MNALTERVLLWLAAEDAGASSKAIALTACGMEPYPDYPHDPDDLGRCIRLLRLIPEARVGICRLAARSPVWAALALRWDEVCEVYGRGDSVATYALLWSIINHVEAANG